MGDNLPNNPLPPPVRAVDARGSDRHRNLGRARDADTPLLIRDEEAEAPDEPALSACHRLHTSTERAERLSLPNARGEGADSLGTADARSGAGAGSGSDAGSTAAAAAAGGSSCCGWPVVGGATCYSGVEREPEAVGCRL